MRSVKEGVQHGLVLQPEDSSLSSHMVGSRFCSGSTVPENSSPTSSAPEQNSVKSEPNMAASPYAGQTVTSATQVELSQCRRWTDVSCCLYLAAGSSRCSCVMSTLQVVTSLSCLQTASPLDRIGQLDIKYEDYPFTLTSMTSPHSWCALSQA